MLPTLNVVVFRTKYNSVVGVHTGKHLVIHGHYFMAPYALNELLLQVRP
jgi:hypothetical protein